MQKQPSEADLFAIYLEKEFDLFCEFGGITGEGRRRALAEWKRRQSQEQRS